MKKHEVRQADKALDTLEDVERVIFGRKIGNATIILPFGGNNKRELSEKSFSLVLRNMYDEASTELEKLGVEP